MTGDLGFTTTIVVFDRDDSLLLRNSFSEMVESIKCMLYCSFFFFFFFLLCFLFKCFHLFQATKPVT